MTGSFGKGVQVKGSAKLEGAHGRVEAGTVLGRGHPFGLGSQACLPTPSSSPLPVEDYLERVLARIEPMQPFDHPLMDAIGLPVADDVRAEVSLPGFDNSGMDGYAVAFRDVAEANADRPVHLPVVGEIAAGQTTIFSLIPSTTVRIMTGAPIPAGASAVVPFEWTEEAGREVLVRRAPEEGQHIRFAGEEVQKGDLLMKRGEVIGTRQVGLLAALGRGRVPTSPRPRVVVMSTGAELVEPGDPWAATASTTPTATSWRPRCAPTAGLPTGCPRAPTSRTRSPRRSATSSCGPTSS